VLALLKHTGVAEEKTVPQKRETLTSRVTRLEELTEVLLNEQIRSERSAQALDERISKLVSAIGKLISRMPPLG
jgi:hypothetical protein